MSDKPYLLVVEDDEGLREQLKWAFSNYEVITAQDKNEAISKLRRYEPGVVTLDLGLPPDPSGYEEGLNILQEIVSLSPSTKVIMVTGQSDRIVAMQAINSGAYDFYVKPIDPQALNLIIDRAYYLHTLEKEYNQLNTLTLSHSIKGILTSSPIMQKVCRTVQKVASTNI
ncbi:MAG TPA: response regulator, partial [Candidatus Berkiella sp.]|nr:response regulator [Candidatus Berkiella sp.]